MKVMSELIAVFLVFTTKYYYVETQSATTFCLATATACCDDCPYKIHPVVYSGWRSDDYCPDDDWVVSMTETDNGTTFSGGDKTL